MNIKLYGFVQNVFFSLGVCRVYYFLFTYPDSDRGIEICRFVSPPAGRTPAKGASVGWAGFINTRLSRE